MTLIEKIKEKELLDGSFATGLVKLSDIIDILTEDSKDSIVEEVRNELLERSNVGIRKYGTSMDRQDLNLEDWIQHCREELFDASLYLTKIKRELSSKINQQNLENSNY